MLSIRIFGTLVIFQLSLIKLMFSAIDGEKLLEVRIEGSLIYTIGQRAEFRCVGNTTENAKFIWNSSNTEIANILENVRGPLLTFTVTDEILNAEISCTIQEIGQSGFSRVALTLEEEKFLEVRIEGSLIYIIGQTAKFRCVGNTTEHAKFIWNSSNTEIANRLENVRGPLLTFTVTDEILNAEISCTIKEISQSGFSQVVLTLEEEKALDVQIEGHTIYATGQTAKFRCVGNTTENAKFIWNSSNTEIANILENTRGPLLTFTVTDEMLNAEISCTIQEIGQSGFSRVALTLEEGSIGIKLSFNFQNLILAIITITSTGIVYCFCGS